jgi:tetratricopeptide (TPR) repeat protein
VRIGLLILSACLAATCAAEQAKQCGGGRTVDDYLADIAKSQKKKRTKNPLPDSICVFGWCRDKTIATTPGPLPDPPKVDAKEPSTVKPAQQPPPPPPGESSSKRPLEEVAGPPKTDDPDADCDPMAAAHDVEVGDWQYQDKSYRGAVGRYKGALENWPGEPNILFRLAKTYERMKDTEHALEYYKLVVAADPDAPLAKEANAAISRLKK